MFYEDVTIEPGDTLGALALAYGHKGRDWTKIWSDPKNKSLVEKRKDPRFIRPGDILQIQIPWMLTHEMVAARSDGAEVTLERNGELGTRLCWVQTVDQGNQPEFGTVEFCVDGCPADDDLPFYYTNVENARDPGRRKRFHDYSNRSAPHVANGTTQWRGTTSLAAVTGQRVTVWNTIVWGWDREPSGNVNIVGPSDAGAVTVLSHLVMLATGRGTGPIAFGAAGWTFRDADRGFGY
jgi:hypothetical protein